MSKPLPHISFSVRKIYWVGLIVFGLIFCSISLVNHYLFRTYALDLGMFNHALYHFAHFQKNIFMLTPWPQGVSFFGDHFSPIILLFAPLYYLFGSYTLLLVQIASILLGAVGVFRYCQYTTIHKWLPVIVMFHFLSMWGIYSALAFDFHTNIVASMLVPWFLLYLEKKNIAKTILFVVLILICKENEPLWVLFIILGIIWKSGFSLLKEKPVFIAALFLFVLVYAFVILKLVMPYFSDHQQIVALKRYTYLGDSFSAIVSNFFTHPLTYLSYFFIDSNNPDAGMSSIKKEVYYMFLLSGGILTIRYPWFLFMLVPVFAQKFLSSEPELWLTNGQYSIEFVPITSICVFYALNKVKNVNVACGLAIIIVLSTIRVTSQQLAMETFNYKKTLRFLSSGHYQSHLNITAINQALATIPEKASLSASAAIAPHVAGRDTILHFPIIDNASYIAVFTDSINTYPLNVEAYFQAIHSLIESKAYDVLYDKNYLLILRKNNIP